MAAPAWDYLRGQLPLYRGELHAGHGQGSSWATSPRFVLHEAAFGGARVQTSIVILIVGLAILAAWFRALAGQPADQWSPRAPGDRCRRPSPGRSSSTSTGAVEHAIGCGSRIDSVAGSALTVLLLIARSLRLLRADHHGSGRHQYRRPAARRRAAADLCGRWAALLDQAHLPDRTKCGFNSTTPTSSTATDMLKVRVIVSARRLILAIDYVLERDGRMVVAGRGALCPLQPART